MKKWIKFLTLPIITFLIVFWILAFITSFLGDKILDFVVAQNLLWDDNSYDSIDNILGKVGATISIIVAVATLFLGATMYSPIKNKLISILLYAMVYAVFVFMNGSSDMFIYYLVTGAIAFIITVIGNKINEDNA